ncbi:MAG: hypothetical protein PHV21_07035, partial [Synergistaceae bacterium]|nr:hypothetical protein [Synergistaceae bacterium]
MLSLLLFAEPSTTELAFSAPPVHSLSASFEASVSTLRMAAAERRMSSSVVDQLETEMRMAAIPFQTL